MLFTYLINLYNYFTKNENKEDEFYKIIKEIRENDYYESD